MAKIKINKLPKGYMLKGGQIIKEASMGGQPMGSNYDDKQSYATTLKPVPREEANIEAEKGETVLTDISGDGTYQMFNIGGKRHAQGGTPLNLPEQSFIYSDTRKMLLTKDEMAELGIEGKKRITPAKASKKFAIKEYMDILKDESSDELAISTAESMIKKNKVKLSQLAFIQERKKNFEDGLPIAAYPYLLENGIDPRMVEEQIEKAKTQASNQGQQGPQGPPPSPEASQQKMVQQPPAPQGPPPQGPGGPQGQPTPEMMMAMQQQMAQQQQMANLGGGMPDNSGNLNTVVGEAASTAIRTPYSGLDGNFSGPMGKRGLEIKAPKLPSFRRRLQNGGTPETADTYKNKILKSVENAAVDCKTTLCSFEQWAAQYRMKDTQETRFMYESYKTKAIDQMNAPGVDTEIMPGHENLQNMPYGNMPGGSGSSMANPQHAGWTMKDMLKMFIPGDNYDYVVDDPMQGMKDLFGLQNGGDPDALLGNTTDHQLKMGNDTIGNISDYPTGIMFDPNKTYIDSTGNIIRRDNISNYPTGLMWDPNKTQIGPDGNIITEGDPNFVADPNSLWGNISEFVGNSVSEGTNQLKKLFGYQMGGNIPGPATASSAADQDRLYMQQLVAGLKQLGLRKNALMNDYQNNPDAYQNPEDEKNLSMQLTLIDTEINSLQARLKEYEEKELLRQTTLSLSDFIPGMQGQGQQQGFPQEMPTARRGGSIPKYQNGGNSDYNITFTGDQEFEIPQNYYEQDGSYPVASVDYSVDEGNEHALYKNKGMNESADWMTTIAQDNFGGVRDEWIRSYRDGVQNFKGKKNSAGNDISYPSQYSDDELLSIFNEVNSQLLILDNAGVVLENSGENYEKVAKDLGLRVMTKDEIKAWQGMYASLNETKKLPQYQELFSNISTELRGKDRGDTHQSSTGEPQSDADGLLGPTSGGQFVSIIDPEITTTVENDCPEEVVTAKIAECQEQGKSFSRAICDCVERPGDPEIKKIPPYLTFPGDDQEVLFAAQTVNNRDLYLPDREHYIPYMRDPGYVGPRQEIAAITAAVNAQADIGDNTFFTEGKAQDAIDKAINKSAQTNTKIFDNTQAYNVAELNKASEKNAGFSNVYTDEVNTALQNYDNTRLADLENLKDAEITRMDNADKLYELNMQNPNYYWDPQRHSMQFYNQDGIDAVQNPGGQFKSYEQIYSEVSTNNPSMSDENKRLLATQIYENQGGPGGGGSLATDIRSNNQTTDTEEGRYGRQVRYGRGGTTRQRRLNESKIKMRNFLLGIS